LPAVKLFGLEYDERLIETAINNVPYAQIMRGSSENLEFENDSFDVVTSFQVIEHVFDPESMAREMLRVLKPNGILVITTPNLSGLGRRLEGPAWHGFRDDHVSLKSYGEWRSMLSSVGMKEIAIRSTFFSGIKVFQSPPLSIINQSLLFTFGYANWSYGESFVGFYTK
jgi:SAM-dependent methyltransferase